MRIHADRHAVLYDVVFVVDGDGAGSFLVLHRVHDEDRVATFQVIGKIQYRRAQVRYAGTLEVVQGFEWARDVRTDGIVAHQDIADSCDGDWLHSAFTLAILLPSGSNVCTAHAMHGSNECTVRRTSSGISGLAMGLCISEASYGPEAPFSSRGDAFHVVGTTA